MYVACSFCAAAAAVGLSSSAYNLGSNVSQPRFILPYLLLYLYYFSHGHYSHARSRKRASARRHEVPLYIISNIQEGFRRGGQMPAAAPRIPAMGDRCDDDLTLAQFP